MGDDDEKLVNLNNFKKEKERRDRQTQKASPKPAGSRVSPQLAQKLVLAAFFLVILWLAMPKDFIPSLAQALFG